MEEEKKMYAWMPSNCERFCETYGSIEEAVAEAQNQWDEKYEYYDKPALKAHSFRGGMKTQTDASRYVI